MNAPAPSPPVSRVELADGGHLTFREAGSGPSLVLLHGGALDHRMWDPQLVGLSTDHRVVALDARGHGWSSTPTEPFRHCDDVAELITALDLRPTTLVGVSMGGSTAVDTALEHPRLVDRLVVCGTGTSESTFRDPWLLERVAAWHAAGERLDAEAWLDAFMAITHGPDRTLGDLDPELISHVRTMAAHTVATHVPSGEVVPPTQVTRTWERAANLRIPVLTLAGTADAADHIRLPEELADVVPGAKNVRIEGAAHYPNLERPEAFEAVLRDFLGTTD